LRDPAPRHRTETRSSAIALVGLRGAAARCRAKQTPRHSRRAARDRRARRAEMDFRSRFFVDISQYVDIKHRMFRFHASPMWREATTAAAPLDTVMRRRHAGRTARRGAAAAEVNGGQHAFNGPALAECGP
jgi:LmbE family N-acetylglucosaminyl deacetylase